MEPLVRDVGTLVEFASTDLPCSSRNEIQQDNDDQMNRIYLVDVSTLSPPVCSKSSCSGHLTTIDQPFSSANGLITHLSSKSHSSLVEPNVSLCVVGSLMYGLGISAIGVGFTVAYMLMYRSRSFDVNVYHGFHVFLYSVGIIVQLVFLFCKLFELCESVLHRPGKTVAGLSFEPFGTVGFRFMLGVFGVVASFWFLLEFSWRLDILRTSSSPCSDRRIEIAVLGLAMFYCLIHLHVMFYNAKLVVHGLHIYVLFGMMHLFGTDVSSFSWTCAHFVMLTLFRSNVTDFKEEICDSSSVLSNIVHNCHPYLGVILLVFFLMASALLIAAFVHFRQHGSFLVQSRLDRMISAANHQLSCTASLIGFIFVMLLFAGSVVFIVYHYMLIGWHLSNDAWLIMEVFCVFLAIFSLACNFSLFYFTHISLDNLIRGLCLEGIVLLVSLIGLILYELLFTVGSLHRSFATYLEQWAAAAAIVKMIEAAVQATFLLNSLKYYANFLPSKRFSAQQSLVLYLCFYNFVFAIFSFMRQNGEIYGRIFSNTYGVIFSAIVKFLLNSFVILYRLFCCICYGNLWARTFRSSQ